MFTGIAIQPAIAVNPISGDNEDDCDICPKVSKIHLVRLKSLLNRVETLNNKLLVMSKLNPEIVVKYQELFDFKWDNENNDTTRWCFPILCMFLAFPSFVGFMAWARFSFPYLLHIMMIIGEIFNCYWKDWYGYE